MNKFVAAALAAFSSMQAIQLSHHSTLSQEVHMKLKSFYGKQKSISHRRLRFYRFACS